MNNYVIRYGVFETNSSSSHSLTIPPVAEILSFDKKILRAGVLDIACGDYNWEWHRYYLPENKISYIVTQLIGDQGYSDDYTPINDNGVAIRAENGRLDYFLTIIEEYAGVKINIISNSGGVDHQSTGNGLGMIDKKEDILNLIFANGSFIETGNDNSSAPATISSDCGSVDYYAHLFKDTNNYVLGETNTYNISGWDEKILHSDTGIELSHDWVKKELANNIVTSVVRYTSRHDDEDDLDEAKSQFYDRANDLGLSLSKDIKIKIVKSKDSQYSYFKIQVVDNLGMKPQLSNTKGSLADIDHDLQKILGGAVAEVKPKKIKMK